MKKIISCIFLLISFIASAQTKVDTTSSPIITEAGKPDGAKTEIKVTKDGGSIKSSDEKIELIIPEGAVSKKTVISIQPVKNLMSNGSGKAYRLEPSGIQFEKPLQLILHYNGEDTRDSMQLLLGIAMQDESGQWFGLNEFTIDTTAKTVSGYINHFSTWAAFEKLKLVTWPPVKRLKVKHIALLQIAGVSHDPATPEEIREMSPEQLQFERDLESSFKKKYGKDVFISPLRKRREPVVVFWDVNGFPGGNAVTGTLELPLTMGSESQVIFYTAPANVPDQNPVTISTRLIGLPFFVKGVKFKDPTLTTSILIYDNAYEVSMVCKTDGWGSKSNVTYTDSGSFVVEVSGKNTKLIEKLNKNTLCNIDYQGECKPPVVLKPGTGNIHIIRAQSINVIPGNTEGERPTIDIWFKPAPMILPLLQFTCPTHKGWFTTTTAMANAIGARVPAHPTQIKFIAKEGEQVIWELNHPGLYYKFSVKKLEKDDY